MALISCPDCSTEISEHAEVCNKCSYPLQKLNRKQKNSTTENTNEQTKASTSTGIDLDGLDSYYQNEFTKIHQSNGSYKGAFNFYSFFFSWLWLFTKGCWMMGLIVMAASAINVLKNGHSTAIILSLVFAILCGIRGNWIYYNVKINNKQFPN